MNLREGAILIDNFSSAIGEMKRKDQRNPLKVLRVLLAHPKFSVFEATDNRTIAKTLDGLQDQGLIEHIDRETMGYPWTKVRVTDKGHAALAASKIS